MSTPEGCWRCWPATGSSRWLDPDSSPDADGLLRQFDLRSQDLPVVIVAGGSLCATPAAGSFSMPSASSSCARATDRSLRSAGRRRWSGRTRCRRLRRLGRADHDAGRGHRARRPGRDVVSHRELSRLPGWSLRGRADGSGRPPGQEIRGAHQAGLSGRGPRPPMRKRIRSASRTGTP
jgi:hypothetical protein